MADKGWVRPLAGKPDEAPVSAFTGKGSRLIGEMDLVTLEDWRRRYEPLVFCIVVDMDARFSLLSGGAMCKN